MNERTHATAEAAPRAIVVAVDLGDRERPLAPELEEFAALIEATGARILETMVQARGAVDPASLIGSGKAHEVAERAKVLGATIVFVFNDLRPRQRINLEKIVPLPIVDRTMVILDIFARYARSKEGQLQVELAQLRYRQSNLIGAGAALSRLGGGIGSRGPGETKLEVDRRRIQSRVSWLRRSLETVRRQRGTRRASHAGDPLVALVGYTNAGKSSLLNRLTNADAYVADRPFATLDPTLRRAFVGTGEDGRPRYVMLADTVGFITDLPEQLVNAFRATLEELQSADLLVHVIDLSNSTWRRQRASVEGILHELQLDDKPQLLVFNKADTISAGPEADGRPPAGACVVSARTGAGIDELRERLRSFAPRKETLH